MVGVAHHGGCGIHVDVCVVCIGKDFFLSSVELTVFIRRLRNTKHCMCFDFVYMTILGQNARFTITQGFKALVAITHQMTNYMYIYLYLIPHICSLTHYTH